MNRIFTILLLAAIMSGCSETVSNNDDSGIMPLKEGNEWTYEVTEYDSTHTSLGTGIDTLRLEAPVARGGEMWYRVSGWKHSYDNDSTFYFNRSNGTWSSNSYAVVGGEHTVIAHEYKYPTVVGDTFDTQASIGWPYPGQIEKEFRKTISTNESVAIPLGTFACIHYRRYLQYVDSATSNVLQQDTLADQFVTPGIGEIKLDEYFFVGLKNEPRTRETILKSYKFK